MKEDMMMEGMDNESGLNMDEEIDRANNPTGGFFPGNGFTKGKLSKVFISAVKKDGTAIRIQDQWYEINAKTKNETGELKKGMKVNLYFSKGEKKNFANAIYPVAETAPVKEAAVAV
jgi:hypothetical protein